MNERTAKQDPPPGVAAPEELTDEDIWLYRKFLPIFVSVSSLTVIFLIGWYFFGFGLGFLYVLGFPLTCGLGIFAFSQYKKKQSSPQPIAPSAHSPAAPHAGLAPSGPPQGFLPPWERATRPYATGPERSSEEGFLASSIRTAVKGIVGLILIGCIAFGLIFILNLSGNVAKNKENSAKAQEPAARLQAAKIMSEYEANEVGADSRYKDKIVEVTGEIDHVGKDILDDPYVTLKTNNPLLTVQCYFEKESSGQLGSLSIGSRVSICGRCDGKFGNVVLKECELRK